ncbi:ATP-binding protein [Halorubrum ejinorense]|uniref:ATP-binding protein n=1 Tax=Halorubrum ejinorense TaxID=425309 RepID=A0AAV3SSG4_9EURY
MRYDAHEVDRLNSRYTTELNKAEDAADGNHPTKAAEHYRNAADAKEAIAHERGMTVPERVHELREIADRAEKGDAVIRSDQASYDHGRPNANDRGGPNGDRDEPSEFREVIESFIVDADVTWEDIGGLSDTKQRLRQTLALGAVGNKPAAVKAAQSTLMFGPPGTGKTLLAKAVATETDATFFNVKLGSLLSKWYGQSSQKIINLFEVARELSPSVIFLDEIDAVTTSRGGGGSDNASRRVLGTLLSELSELRDDDSFTYVIGATNTPWDLDFAIRRRFDNRQLVPLPDQRACQEIVEVHTVNGGVSFTGAPTDHLPDDAAVELSSVSTVTGAIGMGAHQRGFTGSDIEALAGEIIANMVHRTNPDLAEQADRSLTALQDESLETTPIEPAETRAAFETISPSLSAQDIERFHEWDEQYGTG